MNVITPEEAKFLINLANEARRRAYAPYSNYPVGAAVRTKSGRVFTGVNVENAAYPTTMCAERVAIYKAISEGEREFEVIAVVTPNGGTPCGSCRQVMAEFGLDTIVLIGNADGKVLDQTTVNGLLPGAFTPAKLKGDGRFKVTVTFSHAMIHSTYLALGTNLGDRPSNLQAATDALAPDIEVLDKSPVYETEPWGYTDQPPFLNMALHARTGLSPQNLLDRLKGIEATLGRIPSFRNGPRLIDLDILFYDDLTLATPALVIPHPRLHERTFVLIPLAEIAPGLIHPVLRLSVAQLTETVDRHGINLFPG